MYTRSLVIAKSSQHCVSLGVLALASKWHS